MACDRGNAAKRRDKGPGQTVSSFTPVLLSARRVVLNTPAAFPLFWTSLLLPSSRSCASSAVISYLTAEGAEERRG